TPLPAATRALAEGRLPLPAGAKVYVEPMAGGFEVFFMSAMAAKHVPLAITLDKSQADYAITGSGESQKAGWAKIILAHDANSREEMSVVLSNIQPGAVLWTRSAINPIPIGGKGRPADL